MNYIYKDIVKLFKHRHWHEKIYLFFYYIAWIMYILSLLGLPSLGIDFFKTIQQYLRIYISLFLVIKFNPFGKTHKSNKISKFDKTIAFQGGLFILTTSLLNNIITKYLSDNKIHKILSYL